MKMQCDMCGTNQPLVKAKIEGSIMDVCQSCARFGEMMKTPRRVELNKKPFHKQSKQPDKIQIIVPNYYDLIRKAREKMGLKQEDAAKKLAEKESLYHRIEKGQVKPSMHLAKKLEAFFKIKIVEEYSDKMQATIAAAPMQKNSFTIGDMIRMKK